MPEPAAADEHLRQLIDGVRDFAIVMLDPDGRVSTWNAGAQLLYGYGAGEIIGKDFSCFFRRDDVAAGIDRHEFEIARRDDRYEGESWRVRKDGSQFWAHAVISTLRNPGGRLTGFGKITRDLTEQHRAREQLRLAIEAAPTGMIMADRQGRIVLVNAQIERLFGYRREELIGHTIEMLVPERFRIQHPHLRKDFFSDPRSRPLGAGRDLYGLRKDGTELPIEIGLNPLETPEGAFVLSSVVDITARKRAEREREELMGQLEDRVQARTAQLTATLKEREILLQEVHHRVKNNLQMISSLVNLQLRRVADDTSRHALRECQDRLQAIALIHQQLYQSKDFARIPFAEYTKSLAANVFQAVGVSPQSVSLQLALTDISLPVDKAIPCGLMLNELITNALKHAFPDGRAGTIRIELGVVRKDRLMLLVSDDGVGLPKGLDLKTPASLGLQLVRMLARQVDAELEIVSTAGTTFRLTIPVQAAI